MIGYSELVVRVTAQQRVVYFMLFHAELVANLRYRFRVYYAAILESSYVVKPRLTSQ